jgi:cytochrome c oxidase accessory protein FixG
MSKDENFRDKISTIDESGKRAWIYPKKPKGKFFNYRKILTYFLLILMFAGPHLRIAGKPVLLFNILERKFVIFGQIFWPNDFYIFAVAMIVMVVFITLFTIIFGRLFCGWICPQTIFMEMIFRRIEYLIEGDASRQKKLTKQNWNFEKIWKRVVKYVLFLIISFLIANTFLAYIIGSEELWKIQIDDPANHAGGLISIAIFTVVFFFVYAWLREQVCTVICPYGRLQSVLLDENSIVVGYDYKRGENRAKFKKKEVRKDEKKGDCIDCNQCVDVCPTGIDIRNGTQLECINCTACIDACDFMMENVGMEKGLIRLVSENGIKENKKFEWNRRNIFYTSFLVILLAILVSLIASRKDFEATVYKVKGMTFTTHEDHSYSNIYDLVLSNKTSDTFNISIELLQPLDGTVIFTSSEHALLPESKYEGRFQIKLTKEQYHQLKKHKIKLVVLGNNEEIEEIETSFSGPIM